MSRNSPTVIIVKTSSVQQKFIKYLLCMSMTSVRKEVTTAVMDLGLHKLELVPEHKYDYEHTIKD